MSLWDRVFILAAFAVFTVVARMVPSLDAKKASRQITFSTMAGNVPIKNLVLEGNLDAAGYSITNVTSVVSTNGVPVVAGGFPVFHLELGAGWTEVSLKASTDNFANLCYYHNTWEAVGEAGDNSPKVYYLDSGSVEPKALNLATNEVAIALQYSGGNSIISHVVVSPSRDLTVDADTWMNFGNSTVQWIYCRGTVADVEKDDNGKVIWRKTEPVGWKTEQVNP